VKTTKIQWCDDTCNPMMGCDGCELWPSEAKIARKITGLLSEVLGLPRTQISRAVKTTMDQFTNEPFKDVISKTVLELTATGRFSLPAPAAMELMKQTKSMLKCYAGTVTSNRGGHKGYPTRFENPTCFPGRMAAMARGADLTGTVRPTKPWLNGLPRLIFVSDMGDALSESIPFEYLKEEIIEVALSPAGSRHRWLWLTKRPGRMAAFSRWLLQQGIDWPPNVIAMTSVTSEKTVSRVAALEKVICPMRGLSVEPLWTPVKLPLKNVDLVILGGESGFGAERFQLEWARDIHNQCKRAEEVSFFMKQLGRRPFEGSRPLKLRDGHGGDWDEWPVDLRVREMPRCLYANVAFAESETLATV
jgi:protein gp37